MSAGVIALTALAAAEVALAQAGGGSSGFGGGGGGGGGSFGGSSGSSGTGSSEGGAIVLLVIIGVFLLIAVLGAVGTIRYRRKVKARDARVRTASAEAAEDDAYFAADALEREARELFREAQEAWDRRNRRRLGELVGKDLLVEWERRLDDFEKKGWHNRVEVLGEPMIQYVGLTNREDDADDRAVVRIEAKLRTYVMDRDGRKIMRTGSSSELMSLCEYWTLARRPGGWKLASIEQRGEGDHRLEEAIVASPWSDDRLRDESLTEAAVADGLPEGFTTVDLAELDFAGDARNRALDLALADGRFAPDVLEASARRAVEAWAEAVDGEDAALEAAAGPRAVRELLYGGDGSGMTRLVVRGPRVKRITIAALDVARQPATMSVQVDVGGRRYVEDRDTAAVISGSKASPTTFTECWTMALDGDPVTPWRLIDTGAARTG